MNNSRKSDDLRDVYLHGALGRRFGKHFRLAVATPAEAVRALCVQIKGLPAAIREGAYRVIGGRRGARRPHGEDDLTVGFGAALHVVPVIAGAKGGKGTGIGLAIAGATLLAATLFAGPAGFAAVLPEAIAATAYSTAVSLTAAMTLQGVSMLLAPKPSTKGPDQRLDSFLFGGVPDRPVAGRPVPVTFGTCRVTCIPISVQFRVQQLFGQGGQSGGQG